MRRWVTTLFVTSLSSLLASATSLESDTQGQAVQEPQDDDGHDTHGRNFFVIGDSVLFWIKRREDSISNFLPFLILLKK